MILSSRLVWRSTLIAAVLSVAAACSSSAATAPAADGVPGGASSAPHAVATQARSAAPADPVLAGVSASPADPVLAGVSAALNGLKSYQAKETATGSGYGHVFGMSDVVTSTVVNGTSPAVRWVTTDGDIIEAAGKQWLKSGSSWGPNPYNNPMYDMYGATATFKGVIPSYFKLVGEEKVGGVDTTHYTSTNPGAVTFLVSMADVSDATGTIDMWIVKSDGYPLKLTAALSGTSSGAGNGKFNFEVDITKVNDSGNAVTVPS
jgi:hypothetical protein